MSPHPIHDNYSRWRKGVYRLLAWARLHITGSYITIAAVYILIRSRHSHTTGKKDNSDLTFENLVEKDIPKLNMHRGETVIRRRLDREYICRVAQNKNGEIEQVFWVSDRQYFCWPVRMMIDPGPGGQYVFDVFTAPASRGRGRYRENLAIWIRQLPSTTRSIVVAIDALNEGALAAHRNLGFEDVVRVFCFALFGLKFYYLDTPKDNPNVQWFVKFTGKHLTFDVPSQQVRNHKLNSRSS